MRKHKSIGVDLSAVSGHAIRISTPWVGAIIEVAETMFLKIAFILEADIKVMKVNVLM